MFFRYFFYLFYILVFTSCSPNSKKKETRKQYGVTIVHAELHKLKVLSQNLNYQQKAKIQNEFIESWGRLSEYWNQNFNGNIKVIISAKIKKVTALTSFWNGRGSKIYIPLNVVAKNQTPTINTLTQLVLPNGNRFLAEGLAVYLESEMGPHRSYPNFGKNLEESITPFLGKVNLKKLDATPTPFRINKRIKLSEKQALLTAGSFVSYLIIEYGQEPFKKLYEMTPMTQKKILKYSQERYKKIYDKSLTDLEKDWKTWVKSSTE